VIDYKCEVFHFPLLVIIMYTSLKLYGYIFQAAIMLPMLISYFFNNNFLEDKQNIRNIIT